MVACIMASVLCGWTFHHMDGPRVSTRSSFQGSSQATLSLALHLAFSQLNHCVALPTGVHPGPASRGGRSHEPSSLGISSPLPGEPSRPGQPH